VGISLLDAVNDRALLGSVTPWPEQRKVLEQIDSGRYREVVLALGRRSGKSLMAALVAVHDAAFRDLTASLRAGERRHVVCVASSREQARLLLDYCRELIDGSPLLKETVASDTGDSIAIRQPATGADVIIRALPCSARAGRGLAISTLVADELSHWTSDSEGYQCQDRVISSLRPALAQFKGDGRMLVLSTPWGRSDLFFRLYEQASSGQHPDMLAVSLPTWKMNPTLDRAFFDSEQAKDPETFLGEYGAKFLASGASFLEHERVMACVDVDRFELSPDNVVSPVAAFDASFSKDPSALAIVGRDPDERKQLRLALVRSWRPDGDDLGFSAVLDEVASICKSYAVRTILVDQHASVPVREYLTRQGIYAEERTLSAPSKTAIFGCLKALIYSGRLELYGHEELLSELQRLEVSYAAGGGTVRTPRMGGSHCDLAVAVAMAASELADSPHSGPTVWPKSPGEPMVSRGLMEREF
jgi:phage terminase large subunit-like protein